MFDVLHCVNSRSCSSLFRFNISYLHTSVSLFSSPFIKPQKKMDPEIAKLREERKRKKLTKEIKLLESFAKKPKPVEELIFDKKYDLNIAERIRPSVKLTEDEEDERFLVARNYCRYQNMLAVMDMRWISESIKKQDRALQKLKKLSPQLHESAIKPDECFLKNFSCQGPTLTPPIKRYQPPDGHYIDVTKKWLC
ncbi:unnamed protein product [Thelazia callipaeda]|uniref:Large ribosomal subunit protein mL40 n=1 Tax=Thelazia callipaeda TaxID=103827 RepID=A0A0N5D0R6_THECL|nr:unnamed protein product [Thelazia callipaeda]